MGQCCVATRSYWPWFYYGGTCNVAFARAPPLLPSLLQPFELDHPENPSFLAWNHYPGLTPEQIEDLRTDSGKVPPRLHAHADM